MSIKIKLFLINFAVFVLVTTFSVVLFFSQGVFFSKATAAKTNYAEFNIVNDVFIELEEKIKVSGSKKEECYVTAGNDLANTGAKYDIIVFSFTGNVIYSSGAQDSLGYCQQLLDSNEDRLSMYAMNSLVIFHKAIPDLSAEYFAVSKNVLSFTSLYSASVAWILIMAVTFACLFLIGFFVEENIIFPKLNRLAGGLRQISRGKLDFQLLQSSNDEIGMLCKEFENMRLKLVGLEMQKRELDNKRNDIIAGITHDIKTPITTICAYSKGLMDGIANNEKKKEKYYSMIYNTALALNSLLDRLKDFANINSADRKLNLVATNMVEYLDDFIRDNTLLYKERGAKIVAKLPKKPIYVDIDRVEFTRVFHNIINNSIKYKQQDVVEVTISLSSNEGFVTMIISDDGPGLADKNDLKHIFDSYFRGNVARTNPTKDGSGLGLSIVKNIVLLHNGDVKANSDKGLSIIITIPEGEKKE